METRKLELYGSDLSDGFDRKLELQLPEILEHSKQMTMTEEFQQLCTKPSAFSAKTESYHCETKLYTKPGGPH